MSRSGVYGPARLCTGIFSAADLRLGRGVGPVLDAHMAASPYFRGIRSAVPRDFEGPFLEGYRELGRRGLSLDHYSPDAERLHDLARLAEAQPDVTIIVNHLGGRVDPTAGADEIGRAHV